MDENQLNQVGQHLSDGVPHQHGTHWVCVGQLEKYGSDARCCECTDHECED